MKLTLRRVVRNMDYYSAIRGVCQEENRDFCKNSGFGARLIVRWTIKYQKRRSSCVCAAGWSGTGVQRRPLTSSARASSGTRGWSQGRNPSWVPSAGGRTKRSAAWSRSASRCLSQSWLQPPSCFRRLSEWGMRSSSDKALYTFASRMQCTIWSNFIPHRQENSELLHKMRPVPANPYALRADKEPECIFRPEPIAGIRFRGEKHMRCTDNVFFTTPTGNPTRHNPATCRDPSAW